MSFELVKVYEGRPSWAKLDDWNICVSIHDSWFLLELSRYRKLMIEQQFNNEFRQLKDRYRTFLVIENIYYQELGLNPPRITYRTSIQITKKCKFCDSSLNLTKRHYFGYCDINCYKFYENIRKKTYRIM